MIVRILGEGQFRIAEGAVADLTAIDESIEKAVSDGDQQAMTTALRQLRTEILDAGQPVDDDELADSDLILPGADATLDEVRQLLQDSDEGLIPG